MMPKSAKRFSDDIMLQTIERDHVHDFGSTRSKIIVISRASGLRLYRVFPSPYEGASSSEKSWRAWRRHLHFSRC
jgi:hypothetical protein